MGQRGLGNGRPALHQSLTIILTPAFIWHETMRRGVALCFSSKIKKKFKRTPTFLHYKSKFSVIFASSNIQVILSRDIYDFLVHNTRNSPSLGRGLPGGLVLPHGPVQVHGG